MLSTRVGIAEDVLQTKSLFDTIPEAVTRIWRTPVTGSSKRLANLNMIRWLPKFSSKLFEALHRIYQRFPQEPKKSVLEGTLARLGSQTRRLLRRKFGPPRILGMLGKESRGHCLTFFTSVATERRIRPSEQDHTRCGHYLVDESWLQANDPKRIASWDRLRLG